MATQEVKVLRLDEEDWRKLVAALRSTDAKFAELLEREVTTETQSGLEVHAIMSQLRVLVQHVNESKMTLLQAFSTLERITK